VPGRAESWGGYQQGQCLLFDLWHVPAVSVAVVVLVVVIIILAVALITTTTTTGTTVLLDLGHTDITITTYIAVAFHDNELYRVEFLLLHQSVHGLEGTYGDLTYLIADQEQQQQEITVDIFQHAARAQGGRAHGVQELTTTRRASRCDLTL
jgi:hypothetical protein